MPPQRTPTVSSRRRTANHPPRGRHAASFPILTSVDETRRVTLIVDPRGVVRHVGLRRTARETLAGLGDLLVPVAIAA